MRIHPVFFLVIVCSAWINVHTTLQAQTPAIVPVAEELPSVATSTPEMWFYAQELRRLEDPAQAVRRKAEFRAEQRRQRLAAMQWYGYSNLRPQANPTPWFSSYSPSWSGNHADPYRWSEPRRSTVIIGVRPRVGLELR